jgi:MFS transporter, SP family, sugar:H+ symporter
MLGVSLEQVDKLLVESTPRKSKHWMPTTTFASEMGIDEKGDGKITMVEDVETSDSAV